MTEITHSLLYSWLWSMKDIDGRDMQNEFLRVLHRERSEPTQAMQNGIEFENLVTDILAGSTDTAGHKWAGAAAEVADLIRGGQLQLSAKQRMTVNGYPLLLYGRLDCLKAGTIYDIKFSTTYSRGKYYSSTQHAAYMALIPEATEFVYVISNGSTVNTEAYRREEVPDIRETISEFLNWLQAAGLMELYQERWKITE